MVKKLSKQERILRNGVRQIDNFNKFEKLFVVQSVSSGRQYNISIRAVCDCKANQYGQYCTHIYSVMAFLLEQQGLKILTKEQYQKLLEGETDEN